MRVSSRIGIPMLMTCSMNNAAKNFPILDAISQEFELRNPRHVIGHGGVCVCCKNPAAIAEVCNARVEFLREYGRYDALRAKRRLMMRLCGQLSHIAQREFVAMVKR